VNKKIFISDNKDIGLKCKQWAKNNLPNGFKITDSIEECDIFISVLYDKILDKDFIESRDCYNFHPAILPEYAGVGTMTWSILNKEKFHGITLHLIDEGIDTGDIIDITEFEIDDDETSHSLFLKTMEKTLGFFKNKLYIILHKKYKVTKQDFSKRKVYTYKDLDGLLNLSTYMKATYFPDKPGPYYYDKVQKKRKLIYE
jgi:methionyl-tRNA formyltransferase